MGEIIRLGIGSEGGGRGLVRNADSPLLSIQGEVLFLCWRQNNLISLLYLSIRSAKIQICGGWDICEKF